MAKYAPGISAPFGFSAGYRDGKYFHHGQDYFWLNADIAGSRKVYAAGAGTVTKIEWLSTLGQCITIKHTSTLSTRYCHMPKDSAKVKVGQSVTTSTYLGPMGNAGTDAFGAYHLHFEAWVNGTRVDPAPYFTGTAGGDVTPIGETEMIATQYHHVNGADQAVYVATPFSLKTIQQLGISRDAGKAAFGGETRVDGPDAMKPVAAVIAENVAILQGLVGGAGGSTDLSAVTKALAELDTKVSEIPTADENGDAARAKIVK